jgi:hypothetical protein
VKMAQGYITDDGTFFESKVEAALYEAEMRLRMQLAHLTAFPKLDSDAFLAVVFEVRTQLRSYLDAHQAVQAAARDQQPKEPERVEAEVSEEAPPMEGGGYVSGTEEDLARLLKLPTRGHSNVPDVGGGSWPEEVPDSRKVDGP